MYNKKYCNTLCCNNIRRVVKSILLTGMDKVAAQTRWRHGQGGGTDKAAAWMRWWHGQGGGTDEAGSTDKRARWAAQTQGWWMRGGEREGGTDKEGGTDDGTGMEACRMCQVMSICSGVLMGAPGLHVLASTCLAWSAHAWQARYISLWPPPKNLGRCVPQKYMVSCS